MSARGPLMDGEAIRELIDDVQRLGLTSAATVAHRFAGMVRATATGDGAGLRDSGMETRGDVPGLATMIDGWRAVMRGMVDLAQSATAGPASAPPTVGSVEPLELTSVAVGGVGRGRAYLHNTRRTPVTNISIRSGDLVAAGGAVIPASAVAVAPDHIVEAHPESSRQIDIAVNVSADQSIGVYYGLLVMSDPPGGVLAIQLEVVGRGGS